MRSRILQKFWEWRESNLGRLGEMLERYLHAAGYPCLTLLSNNKSAVPWFESRPRDWIQRGHTATNLGPANASNIGRSIIQFLFQWQWMTFQLNLNFISVHFSRKKLHLKRIVDSWILVRFELKLALIRAQWPGLDFRLKVIEALNLPALTRNSRN